jgi:TonB family protein
MNGRKGACHDSRKRCRPVLRSARHAARLFAATLALGWIGEAGAQTAPLSETNVTAPALKTRVEAVYPVEALRERLPATVGLEIVVDEGGRVVEAKVTVPAGRGFDEAALAAVRQFTFEPARRGGTPMKAVVSLSYDFHPPAAALASKAPVPPVASAAPAKALVPAAADEVQRGPNQTTLVLGQRLPTASLHEPEPIAASDSQVDQDELSLRPRRRVEHVVEAVPGLFAVQHAGGGKADQYFLRGFDEDHGTDLAFFVDGMPVNMVSHGHGQGFSDLHFLIPETIDTLEWTKGPYSARVGDFATSGSVAFHMADHLDESLARAEVGPEGGARVVVVESPDFGDRWRMVTAADVGHDNGPFIHPDDYNTLKAYLKATHVFEDRGELSTTVMAYGGDWNMSGVLPARAVCGEGDGTPVPAAYSGSHCISRWDSIDPTQGGSTERYMLLADYRRPIPKGDFEAMAYALRYSFVLFPNDGIAAPFQPEGIRYGSQIEQDDRRWQVGTTVRLSRTFKVADILDVRTTLGLQIRDDDIDSELHRTEGRVRLDGMPGIPGPITDSAINETELGAFAEVDWRLSRWLRFILGAREDRVDVDVSNQSPTAVDPVSGYKGAAQFSPKASAVVSPLPEWDLYANYGRGFHSNDARTIIEGAATTLLATATGYEVGTAVRPLPGLTLTAAGFLLDLTSELTIDGDTASTTPSGPTERYGGEFTGRFDFNKRIYADAAFTATHAQYTDAADIAAGTTWVTLAPRRTFSAGVGTRWPLGPFTLSGSVHVKSMADRPATQNWSPAENLGPTSLTATGFTLFDAEVGLRWKCLEVALTMLNIGNAEWREGQFAVQSRLPQEGPNPMQGISFTPGWPRTVLAKGTVYW